MPVMQIDSKPPPVIFTFIMTIISGRPGKILSVRHFIERPYGKIKAIKNLFSSTQAL